jgi:putative transposase
MGSIPGSHGGWRVNAKRVYRLYREMGLQLRNKTPKRRVKAKLREDRRPATRSNETWAMDFVHDQLATGGKLRVGREIGFPAAIRVDKGSEFVSRDLDLWAYQRGVTLAFSRPGKPIDNAFIESFNGKFRAECLNTHWFMSLDDARRKCEAWRRDYYEERPTQRDRQQGPDRAGQSISGTRPALIEPPGKSPTGWSKDWARFKPTGKSPAGWSKDSEQLTRSQSLITLYLYRWSENPGLATF